MKRKILFLGLASSYTEGMTYQDNFLNIAMVEKGYDVTYISNPEKFERGKLVDTKGEDYFSNEGYRLIRLPYVAIINNTITKKIRIFKGFKKILNDVQPDIIYCHGFQFFPIIEVTKYKKKYSNCRIFVDSHVDSINSAQNWISMNILHKLYYRSLLTPLLKYIEKYLYITESVKEFSSKVYKVPLEIMQFFPLGSFVYKDEEYYKYRSEIRKKLGIFEKQRLFVHSGKMDYKKKTKELIESFIEVKDLNAKLIIIGIIEDEYKEAIKPLIKKDSRIEYIGWKDGYELNKYLCAADLYCQPGNVSATLQNAICCRCACLCYPDITYKTKINRDNIIFVKTKEDIVSAFKHIEEGKIVLPDLMVKSYNCATEILDYRKNISLILEE